VENERSQKKILPGLHFIFDNSPNSTFIFCACRNDAQYLTMLLEMGILHCDPHPGNLLRTPDGKLCILGA
jgi:thiamine kinase-like enzyme